MIADNPSTTTCLIFPYNLFVYALLYLDYIRRWRCNYPENVRVKFPEDYDLVYYEAMERGWSTTEAFLIAMAAQQIVERENGA